MDIVEIVTKKIRIITKKLHKINRKEICKIQGKPAMRNCPKYGFKFGNYDLNDIILLVVLTKKKKLPVIS